MEQIEYQVLAPDSVAWHIQAALVADRTGNHHTRDLALREAQRIADERRLAAEPCYDCRTTGERLAELGHQVGLLQAEHVTPADVQRDRDWLAGLTMRIGALEAAAAPAVANQAWMAEIERRLAALEAAAPPPGHHYDGGHWITCPFCVDDELGMCSACDGTRRIWEMPREDGA